MARKKRRKDGPKHNDPRESFHLPVQLQLALECAAAVPDLPSNKSAVLRASLEAVMRKGGWFPLTEENLRKLLDRVDVDDLSPHAQAHLRKAGLLPGAD